MSVPRQGLYPCAAVTAPFDALPVRVHISLAPKRYSGYASGSAGLCEGEACTMVLIMPGQPEFMHQAIHLATENVLHGRGGPFGAVVVKDGKVIATGANQVAASNDPTAHAEIVAIRNACQALGTFQLTDCEVYTSCEPCPMCLAALYWSRCEIIYYGNEAGDAARAGFDDSLLYDELKKPHFERRIPIERMLADEARSSFEAWQKSPYRVEY